MNYFHTMNNEIKKHLILFFIAIFVLISNFLNANQYAHVDNLVLKMKDLNEKDILQLTYRLTQPFEKTEEKVRAVFTWITANIEYDLDILQDNRKRAKTFQEVLDSKKDVCSGYAMLFKAMMDKMGVECEIISGHSKGYNYEIGNLFNDNNSHAWNAVKIKNKWHLIDPTWGSGYIKDESFVRSFNDYYFFTPAEEFIHTHYPTDRKWQLLQPRIHRDEFENSVYLKSAYFQYNIKIKSHTNYTIETENSVQIKLFAPQDVLIEASIYFGENQLDNRYVFTQRQNDVYEINALFPYAETYTLRLFAKQKSESIPLKWILDYRVITNNDADELVGFPKKYQGFDQHNVFIYFPLTKFLTPGKETSFKIFVNDCEKVALIHGDSFNFFKLNNGIFEGKFIIPKSKIYIGTNKPGSNQFVYLLEFDSWK